MTRTFLYPHATLMTRQEKIPHLLFVPKIGSTVISCRYRNQIFILIIIPYTSKKYPCIDRSVIELLTLTGTLEAFKVGIKSVEAPLPAAAKRASFLK